MEEQCTPPSWDYHYQQEELDGLTHTLLYSTLEQEAALISRKDEEILHLKDLLTKIINEREEFQIKSQQLMLEKQLLLQQAQIQAHSSSNITTNEDDLSPSDSDDIITASPPPVIDATDKIPVKKPLPEQGKFLQAVREAGPLLQTLLLAGPLPQWQHPPPQFNSGDIPPVKISSPATKAMQQGSCLISLAK